MKIKENEKRDKFLDIIRKLKKKKQQKKTNKKKKLWKLTGIPIELGTIPKGLVIGLEEFEIRYHSNYSIVDVSQNTEKSPRDLRRLAVFQTPMKHHQLMLVENLTRYNNNNNNNNSARPSWNTWLLVQEIHLHSRQTSTRDELMLTRRARTWMDDHCLKMYKIS